MRDKITGVRRDPYLEALAKAVAEILGKREEREQDEGDADGIEQRRSLAENRCRVRNTVSHEVSYRVFSKNLDV